MERASRPCIVFIASQTTDSWRIMGGSTVRASPPQSEIELDLGRYELRRGGRPVKLERKPMELLIFLVRRRDQLVLRSELVAKLWSSDLFVDTERNLHNIVRKVRAALGDDAEKPRFLETVVGKGYRFTGPVRVIGARPAGEEGDGDPGVAGDSRPDAWRERTSLAVLPLRLLGNAVDDRGISLGFADALIARLGNLQGVDVLPVTTVLNVPEGADPAEVAAR